ncbi:MULTISPECIES: hypothetical protein [Bacillus]|nr:MULTISPECIES: hypothetical protein [Bacillus]
MKQHFVDSLFDDVWQCDFISEKVDIEGRKRERLDLCKASVMT